MEATNMINPTVCQIDQAGLFRKWSTEVPSNFWARFRHPFLIWLPQWYVHGRSDAAVAITMTQLFFLMLTAAIRSFLHTVSEAFLVGETISCHQLLSMLVSIYYRDHPTEIKLQISCGCTESITIRHIEPSRTLWLEETHTAVSWLAWAWSAWCVLSLAASELHVLDGWIATFAALKSLFWQNSNRCWSLVISCQILVFAFWISPFAFHLPSGHQRWIGDSKSPLNHH